MTTRSCTPSQFVEPDAVQLHGPLSDDLHRRLRARGVSIVKALSIGSDEFYSFDERAVDAVMVDGATPGSGVAHSWEELATRSFSVPVIAAGGLSDRNVADVIAETGVWGVDSASGVESAPGVKDRDLIDQLRRQRTRRLSRSVAARERRHRLHVRTGRPRSIRRIRRSLRPGSADARVPRTGGGVSSTRGATRPSSRSTGRSCASSPDVRRPSRHCVDSATISDYAIFAKREDLAHTGSHKINNVIGQTLLTKRMGKRRVIAETGAGQHGVATATAAARLGLECTVFMGEVDTERQILNVFRMELLGSRVVPVTSGSRTLKDAVNEAMREWVTCVEDTHYCIGSVMGPHPFPWMVREFQSIIGHEAARQLAEFGVDVPDVVIACVGGGSNAAGVFAGFANTSARLVGIEAAGGSAVGSGSPGVLHGMRSFLMQDEFGQIEEAHSISAGLDYPGIGPEHAYLADIGRAEYYADRRRGRHSRAATPQ